MLPHRAAERGQTMPFIALLLVALLGIAGLAADVGYLRYEQRVAQSAADSAALAGAAELGFGTDFVAAAQNDAASNGFTNGVNNVTVTAVNPPATGAYISNATAVEVHIIARYNTFFMRVFPNLSTAGIDVRAVAIRSDDQKCLYLLDRSGSSNLANVDLQMPNCGAAINQSGRLNMNGATVDAKSFQYAGAAPNLNGTTFSSATPSPALPVSDPCMEIGGCRYLTNNPPSTNTCGPYNTGADGTGFLSPGCYNNVVNLNKIAKNNSVTLTSGLYVIAGQLNGEGGGKNSPPLNINGTNVTIYVTGGGQVKLNGTVLNLSAPTDGSYEDVLFYQSSSDNNSVNLEGASCGTCMSSLSGLVYFPTQMVNYNHHGGGYSVLVFGSANFNKSESDFTAAPTGQSIVKAAVLAE